VRDADRRRSIPFVLCASSSRAAAAAAQIFIWDAHTGVVAKKIEGGRFRLFEIICHPSRALFVACGRSRALQLWGQHENSRAWAPDFAEASERASECDIARRRRAARASVSSRASVSVSVRASVSARDDRVCTRRSACVYVHRLACVRLDWSAHRLECSSIRGLLDLINL